MSIFRPLKFLFLQPRKATFRSRISYKKFSQPLLPEKKNVGKMAIFGPELWVNPFGKMSIVRLFELFCFYSLERQFSFQNNLKDIFLAYIALKKLEKWPFLDQNHGLTPLEHCQFFDFLTFMFLQPKKAIFRARIS